MKKYIVKMLALLVLTSVAFSSCSLQYRQQRTHRNTQDGNNGRDRNNNNRDGSTYDRNDNKHDHSNDRQYNEPHRY